MSVNNQYEFRARLARMDDPSRGYPTTREELFGYDVVICSDIARASFTAEQLAWTVELVGKRGGGFAMIGGNTSFGSGGWDQTVWDGLIPVDMSGRGPQRSENYWGALRVVIPPQAMDHPIWRIVDDPERNRKVLAALPSFYGTNLTDRLKPAAIPLGLSQGPLPGSNVVTVFSCQTFGRGRTFAMSSDTTVDWGRDFEHNWGEGDNRYFRKFWRNVVRWLAENSEAAQRRLRVDTDKVVYRPGQDILITAKAYDEKIKETDRYRLVARLRGPAEPESRPFEETAQHLVPPELNDLAYRGKLPAPQPAEIMESAGSTLHRFILDVACARRRADRGAVEYPLAGDRRSGRISRSSPGPRNAPQTGPGHGRIGHSESGGPDCCARPTPRCVRAARRQPLTCLGPSPALASSAGIALRGVDPPPLEGPGLTPKAADWQSFPRNLN